MTSWSPVKKNRICPSFNWPYAKTISVHAECLELSGVREDINLWVSAFTPTFGSAFWMCQNYNKCVGKKLGNWENEQFVAGVGRMCFKRLIYQLSSASRWFCFHCSCFKAITTLSKLIVGPCQETVSLFKLCVYVFGVPISEGSVKPGLETQTAEQRSVGAPAPSTLFTAGGTSKALKKMPMMSYHTSIMPFIDTTCCPDSVIQH